VFGPPESSFSRTLLSTIGLPFPPLLTLSNTTFFCQRRSQGEAVFFTFSPMWSCLSRRFGSSPFIDYEGSPNFPSFSIWAGHGDHTDSFLSRFGLFFKWRASTVFHTLRQRLCASYLFFDPNNPSFLPGRLNYSHRPPPLPAERSFPALLTNCS